MRKPNSFQVQDFLLTITSQNTLFTLEAEHEPTGKIFTINLDSDSIGQVTNGLFESVDKLIQGFKEAAENDFGNIRLDITPQGWLIYAVVLCSGVIKKEFGFTISLMEKEMDPMQLFSRKLNLIKSDVEQWKEDQEIKVQMQESQTAKTIQVFEERIDRLENIMIQMEKRLTQFDRLENLMEQMQQKLDKPVPSKTYYFNYRSMSASKFNLTDDNRTATSIFESSPCLEILPQVPLRGQSSYSLRVNNDIKDWTCFGIMNETGNVYWNDYQFRTPSGSKQQPGADISLKSKNSILKMVVDMDDGTLTFFADNRQVNFCQISKADKSFAFVSFGNAGDSVTLI